MEIWKIKLVLSAAIIHSAASRGVKECIRVRDKWNLLPYGIKGDTATEYETIARDLASGLKAALENPTEEEVLVSQALRPLLDYKT